MLQEIVTSIRQILKSSIYSVTPECLFANEFKFNNSNGVGEISIKNYKFPINKNVYIVGFGKAVYGMAYEIEKTLNSHIKKGIISVPMGIVNNCNVKKRLKKNSVISVIEGAKNNLPDKDSYFAAVEIYKLVNSLTENDLLIVLISGGGSSLLSYPIPPITVEEKAKIIKSLASAGADIVEINSVRKKLSCLKGGKLAALAYPIPVISLIISDVVNDPLEFIASGVTTMDNDSADTALKVMNKYNLYNTISENVKQVLRSAKPANKSEFKHVYNIIVGNNNIALQAAKLEAENLGYKSVIVSDRVEGHVLDVTQFYLNLITCLCKYLLRLYSDDDFNVHVKEVSIETKKPYLNDVANVTKNLYNLKSTTENSQNRICLIAGGEPTVKIAGSGLGGRNQELSLYMAVGLNNLKVSYSWMRDKFDIFFLSAGTDGIDGPTDAAGAISSFETVDEAIIEGINPVPHLVNNNSYGFYTTYNNGKNIIKTGHTGTNVMDVHIICISTK